MAEEQTTTPATATPTETLGNAAEARNPDGTIKDSQQTTPPATTSTSTTSETKTSSEGKTEDGKALTDKPGDKKAEGKAEVPEKYEFKAPEGQQIDPKFLEEATPVLKELGLSNDQAQKLVDLYSKRVQAISEAPYNAFVELQNQWRDKVFKDPALGNGSELKPEIKASIVNLIDSMPNAAAFREALVLTGAGNHYEFIKAFAYIAKELGEGTGVSGKGPSPKGQTAPGAAPKSAAAAMYPNLKSSSEG